MATRLYFPATEAAPVTSSFDGNWEYVSEALSRKLADTKGSSAITVGSQIGPWTPGQDALDRQYISTRMNAGIAFTAVTHSILAVVMCREYNNGDNVDRIRMVTKIISEDGSTVRATIYSFKTSNAPGEFINNATHRNVTFGGQLDGSYTTVLGDRILVEIGYLDNAGATPEATAKWGENAADLTANNTGTTEGAGWFEFSNNITFAGEVASPRKTLGLLGVG